jgi:hypothetical protein
LPKLSPYKIIFTEEPWMSPPITLAEIFLKFLIKIGFTEPKITLDQIPCILMKDMPILLRLKLTKQNKDTNKENKLENLNLDTINPTSTNIITILREFLISRKSLCIHEKKKRDISFAHFKL